MARRKSYRRKSPSKIDPITPMIDFAFDLVKASALDVMTYDRKKKKSQVNPYTAAYLANSINCNDDIGDAMRLGYILDATGAYSSEDRNRYAWRLNCEDGSAYGIYPENYETREEYHAALLQAKADSEDCYASEADVDRKDVSPDENVAALPSYLYCRVSRIDNGRNMYYLTDSPDLKIGSTITVPTENGTSTAIVLSVERHTRLTVPQPPEETEKIIEVS